MRKDTKAGLATLQRLMKNLKKTMSSQKINELRPINYTPKRNKFAKTVKTKLFSIHFI